MVLSMDRWVGKVAIVTGASAGVGAAVVENLVNVGMKVAAIARRQGPLDELAKRLKGKKGEIHTLSADMSSEEDVLKAFDYVKKNMGPIHVLVNNAAICKISSLMEGRTEDWTDIYKVNVIGLCIATREAVKDMKAHKLDGHIVHINSISGHRVYHSPAANVYPSSKHAVTALTETLRLEFVNNDLKIKVTSVSPGAIDTEMLRYYFDVNDPAAEKAYRELPKLDPKGVADGVMNVLSTPPDVQISELTIKPVGERF